MTREDINDIINAICPNDEDYEKPCISPKYLRQELEQLALDQKQWNEEPTTKNDLAQERYQDLIEYFGDEKVAKTILESRKQFKAWLERLRWNVKRVDELDEELEQIKEATKNDLAHNLCDSCTNIGCEFQSGIVRTKCAFYIPPQLEPDNCGNYVVQALTTKNDLAVKKIIDEVRKLQLEIIKAIKNGVLLEQESRWIPVSESLPKDSEPVNIIWILHDHAPFYKNIRDKAFTATGVYSNGQWYWWSKSCTDILEKNSHNYADILYDANKAELEAWMPHYDDIINESIEVVAWMALPKKYSEVEE